VESKPSIPNILGFVDLGIAFVPMAALRRNRGRKLFDSRSPGTTSDCSEPSHRVSKKQAESLCSDPCGPGHLMLPSAGVIADVRGVADWMPSKIFHWHWQPATAFRPGLEIGQPTV